MRPSEALRKHRDAVRKILSGFPVENPRIFGSAARGEDTDDSDLDILVERGGLHSYSQIFALEDALSAVLGVRVDVHTPSEFGPRFSARIASDLKDI